MFAKALIAVILIEFVVHALRTFYLRKEATMAQKDSDLQKIKELIEVMKQNDLAEIEIRHGDEQIILKRFQPAPALGSSVTGQPVINPNISSASSGPPTMEISADSPQKQPAGRTVPAVQQQQELVEIKSPIVGTFYEAPSPDSEPYVEIGSHVEPQTVVCIIEAMKVMNEIKAETRGTIAEILVTTGQAVEYGQVLFRVKPD